MIDAAQLLHEHMSLAESQAEKWKKDHEDARDCHVLELLLRIEVGHMGGINELDNRLRSLVLRGEADPAEAERVVTHLYQHWLRGADEILMPLLSQLEAKGYRVEGAEDFRAAYRQVKGILTPDDEFFADGRLVELRDNAIDAYRRGETEEWEVPAS
jgi:hypothetical protein